MARKKQPIESDSDDSDITDSENDILSQLGEDDDSDSDDIESNEEDTEDEDEGSEDEEHEGEEGEDDLEDVDGSRSQDLVNLKPDKKGNLIDPKTGKIVAPSGPARRFYEDLSKTKQRLNSIESQFNQHRQLMSRSAQVMTEMKAKIDAYEGQANLPNQLGLTPGEHAEALQFMAKFKNPTTAIEAIKFVLTRAAQRGINMEGLSAAPLDLSVLTQDITKQISEKFDPIANRFKASDEQQEQQRKADQEVQTFFTQNPEAKQFSPVLVKMAQRPELQHLTLTESWLMLQNYLLRQRAQPGLSKSPSRPGGRASAGNTRRGDSAPDDNPVTVDASYKDIVKQVVKDHGGLDYS